MSLHASSLHFGVYIAKGNASENQTDLDILNVPSLIFIPAYTLSISAFVLNMMVFMLAYYGGCVGQNSDVIYYLSLCLADLISGLLLALKTLLLHLTSLDKISVYTSCMFLVPLLEHCFFTSGAMLAFISMAQLHSIFNPVAHLRYKTVSFSVAASILLWFFALITTFVAWRGNIFHCELRDIFGAFFLYQRDIKIITFWGILLLIASLNFISFIKSIVEAPRTTNPRKSCRNRTSNDHRPINTNVFARISRISARATPSVIRRNSSFQSREEYECTMIKMPSFKKPSFSNKLRDRNVGVYVVESSETERQRTEIKSAWEIDIHPRSSDAVFSKDSHKWPNTAPKFLDIDEESNEVVNLIRSNEDKRNHEHSNVEVQPKSEEERKSSYTKTICEEKHKSSLCSSIGNTNRKLSRLSRTESKERAQRQSVVSNKKKLSSISNMFRVERKRSEIQRISQSGSSSGDQSLKVANRENAKVSKVLQLRPIKGIVFICSFALLYVFFSLPYFVYISFETTIPDYFISLQWNRGMVNMILLFLLFSKSSVNPIMVMIKLRIFRDTLKKLRRKFINFCTSR